MLLNFPTNVFFFPHFHRYLDNVIREQLRVFPLFGVAHRITCEDIALSDKSVLPRGSVLLFNYQVFDLNIYYLAVVFENIYVLWLFKLFGFLALINFFNSSIFFSVFRHIKRLDLTIPWPLSQSVGKISTSANAISFRLVWPRTDLVRRRRYPR